MWKGAAADANPAKANRTIKPTNNTPNRFIALPPHKKKN
jgi:hypothetical protein